nr:MAG TPA: hypothetical protein [Caudoviricetes sp.]
MISYHRFLIIDYLLIYSLAERVRREMGPFLELYRSSLLGDYYIMQINIIFALQ